MTTAIAETAQTVETQPEAPVRVGPPSRLEILRHARELALDVGAVKDGNDMFEDADGGVIPWDSVIQGRISTDRVCGVCVAGAVLLAEVLSGSDPRVCLALDKAQDAAVQIYGQYDGCITEAVTLGGTEYVVAVLDQMIADEEAARA